MKRILKLAFGYSAIEGFQKGLYFLILPILTYYISPKEYGTIAIILMLVSLFQIFFNFSLESTIMRFYTKIKLEKLKKIFIGTIFLSFLLFGFGWILLILIIGPFIFKFILPTITFFPYIFLALLITFFKLINLLYITFLKATQNIKEFAIFFNLYFFIQTLLILMFVMLFHYQKDILYLIGLLISQIISSFYLLFKIKKSIIFIINKKILKFVLNYSFSIIPIKLVNIVNSSIDKYILLNFIGSSMVGIYYFGLQIASVIQMVLLALNSAYIPVFYKLYEKNKRKNDFKEIYKIFHLLVLIAGIIEILALNLSEYIFKFVDEKYYEAKQILPILILYFSLGIIYYINTNILSISADLNKKKAYGVLLGIIINLILSILLVKELGLIGVAIGTLIGFLVIIFYFIFLIKKYTNFNVINFFYLFFIIIVFILNYHQHHMLICIILNIFLVVFFIVNIIRKKYE